MGTSASTSEGGPNQSDDTPNVHYLPPQSTVFAPVSFASGSDNSLYQPIHHGYGTHSPPNHLSYPVHYPTNEPRILPIVNQQNHLEQKFQLPAHYHSNYAQPTQVPVFSQQNDVHSSHHSIQQSYPPSVVLQSQISSPSQVPLSQHQHSQHSIVHSHPSQVIHQHIPSNVPSSHPHLHLYSQTHTHQQPPHPHQHQSVAPHTHSQSVGPLPLSQVPHPPTIIQHTSQPNISLVSPTLPPSMVSQSRLSQLTHSSSLSMPATSLQQLLPQLPSSQSLPEQQQQQKSQVDVHDDVYRWRKYGSKNGKDFVRAYFKCSHAKCPAKKIIETRNSAQNIFYKENHNHKPIVVTEITAHNQDNFKQIVAESFQNSSSSSPNIEESNGKSSKKLVVEMGMNVNPHEDGFSWRKYGQKAIKGNPFPRSYYKCSSSLCPVKKQIVRNGDTYICTYTDVHSHPITKDPDTTELGKRQRESLPINQPNAKRIPSPMYDPNNPIYNYSNTTELSPIRIATTNAAMINSQNINGKPNYSIPVLSQQYPMQNSQDSNNNNLVNLQHQVL